MSVTDEQIAAYADGELEGAELAQVEAAIAADPALARKVEAHRALKAKLAAHFAPILDAPVPDHLSAMLQPKEPPAEVVSLAAERQKRGLAPMVRRWGVYIGPALAAAVVAAAVFLPGMGGSDPVSVDGMAGPQLAGVLDNQLVADQSPDAQTRILLSFEQEPGRLCRVYRGDVAGGIACRNEQGWQIEREMLLGEGQSTEFRQAGSDAELLAAAQSMSSGAALSAEQEAEAKAKGWR